MIFKRIICCLMAFAFIETAWTQVEEDTVNASFFREFYHQGHLAHWLDALSDHTVYQGLHVGQWDESGQLMFSVDGNSFKWNRYYINGFRVDNRFTPGSTSFVPDMESHNLRIDPHGSILNFEFDTLSHDYAAASFNRGNLGGISRGSADIIHLFHGTGIEDANDLSTIECRQYVKYQATADAAYTFRTRGGQALRQHIYAVSGQQMLPDYDHNGLLPDEPLYQAGYYKVLLDGQLPVGQWLDNAGYFVNVSSKDNYGAEFYFNRAEIAKLNSFSASVYGSRRGLTTGITVSSNNMNHSDLQFSRNIIDQDGESLEPWMSDGTTRELTWAVNYNRQLQPWLNLKVDGYNSFLSFNPDQSVFVNNVYYQQMLQAEPTPLYKYVWTSRKFAAGLLENRIGVDARHQLSDKLAVSGELALTVDGMLMDGKSKISPNVQATLMLTSRPLRCLELGLTLAHDRVSYNIDNIRFMSDDYMNADVYFSGSGRLFTTTGGSYHHYAEHLWQPGYFTLNIPVHLNFGRHEFVFLQTYKKFHHTWMAQFKGGAEANGYTDADGYFFLNPGQHDYVIDYVPKSLMDGNFLLNTPFYVSQNSRYTYRGNKVLFSLSWQSMMGAGLSALGNGPVANNVDALSESTANPNTQSTIANPDGKYPGVGRFDQDKAYVCRIYFAHNVNRNIQYGITGRWTDGQPFMYFNTAAVTDGNGDTQVAIRPYSSRGINPTDGNFGCRESALFNIDLHARFVMTLGQHNVTINLLCYNIYDFGNVYNEMCFPEGVRGQGSRGPNMTLTIPRGIIGTLKVDL